ncbi:hypothetical protein [Kitasatospora sp. LaBMicrA B282]|uniref:hypothetical protein n=1 Tax=Kitasatospora sp. LaBMicrA B282 TaxID=3420949 RepID=UPI003D0A7422
MQNADVPPQDRSAGPAADRAPDLREDLLRYAELGGFTLSVETHAWYAAAATVTGAEEARAASTVLAEVRGCDLTVLREAAALLAGEAALREPTTLTEVLTLVALLRRVRETAATLRSGAYEADLDALAAATASGSWRKERGLRISWGRRRKLRAEAKRLAVADRPRREALHSALLAAAAERADWQALAPAPGTTARPVDAELLESTGLAADTLVAALRGLGRLLADRDLIELPFAELADLVDALAADEGTLFRLPELRTLRAGLEQAPELAELLAELTEARADRMGARLAYDHLLDEELPEDVAADPEAEVGFEAEAEDVAEAAEAEDVAEVEAPATIAVPAQAAAEPDLTGWAEPVAEVEVEVEAEDVAEAEVEPITEVEVEPIVEPEPAPVAEVEVVEPTAEVEPAPVAEAAPAVEAEVEAEPAAELPEPVTELPEPVTELPEPEPAVEPEAVIEPVVEPVTPESEPATEPEPEPVLEAESTPAPAEEPEVIEAPTEAPAEAAAPARRPRRPKRPELTAGRPITAYSAEELEALVRWIDSDFVTRSDDELLRAAMKELGFARLGPRIKEALGAAVSAARPTE